jgi:spermidine/putrescine transport system permease protein
MNDVAHSSLSIHHSSFIILHSSIYPFYLMPIADTQFETPGIGRRPTSLAWIMLAPLLLWLIVFVIAPTVIMAVYSVGTTNTLGQMQMSQGVTAAHYARVLDWPQGLALFLCVICGVCGALLGWRLTKVRAVRFTLAGQYDAAIIGTVAGVVGWGLLCLYTLSDWSDAPSALRWFLGSDGRSSFLKIFVTSVNYAGAATIICVMAGYPVAYFIGKAPEKWRNLLLITVMIPFWTSFLVRTYAWVTILRTEGVLNTTLLKFGLIDTPFDDLYPSMTGVMIGLVYTYLPFMILPIYTSIERLDNALVEAAFDLGASPLRAFNNVIFPLTRPGVVAGVLLVFVPAVGMFAVNDILGGRQEPLIGNVIQEQFGKAKNPPFGAALGTLLLLLFIITYYFSTRKRTS